MEAISQFTATVMKSLVLFKCCCWISELLLTRLCVKGSLLDCGMLRRTFIRPQKYETVMESLHVLELFVKHYTPWAVKKEPTSFCP